tara:strand:+ start:140 stop:367 length:228 start_codon:yes stop_codon:yes gene_type:complete
MKIKPKITNPYMGITIDPVKPKGGDPVKPKGGKGPYGQKQPKVSFKKGPVNKIDKKPSKNRMMYNDGGMIKAKPC